MAYRRMNDSKKAVRKEGYYEGATEHDEDHGEEIRQGLRETPEDKDTGLGQWLEEWWNGRQAETASQVPNLQDRLRYLSALPQENRK